MSARKLGWREILIVLLCMLIVYIASYVVLSRRGIALCEEQGFTGLYFFPPYDSDRWRFANYGFVYFYYPLVVVDNWIGTGKGVGCEPMWRLDSSRRPKAPAEPPAP
jgi:hypothetical protein